MNITPNPSDGASGAQHRDYHKDPHEMDNKSKVISTKSLPMIKAGATVTHDARGSSQSYPKGCKVNMTPSWNPQKGSASQFGLKGV